MTIRNIVLGSIVASSILTIAPVMAHDIHADVLADDMTAVALGWTPMQERSFILNQGNSFTFKAKMDNGHRYVFAARCDEDCSDVDLRIIDDNGNLVATDVASDDHPVVSVAPAWSATFKIKATMHRCSAEPCKVIVSSYRAD